MIDAELRWSDPSIYKDLATSFQKKNANLLAALLADMLGGDRCVDFGCGTGFLSESILRLRPRLRMDCVDISPAMLAAARSNPALQGCQFHQASMQNFPGSDYDGLASNAAIHWTAPHFERTFAQVAAALKPGGVFAIATAGKSPASDRFDASIRALAQEVSAEIDEMPFAQRRLTIEQISGLCGAAGLEVADCFMVERHATMPVARYIDWLVASGGPWTCFSNDSSELRRAAEAIFAQAEGGMEVGHWSTVVTGCKK
ncbi:MAG: class I SAM-dependent methyltransferase [Novosphingobium sp.]